LALNRERKQARSTLPSANFFQSENHFKWFAKKPFTIAMFIARSIIAPLALRAGVALEISNV